MKAVVIRQFGVPKLLKVEDVPTPTPKEGEVLVAVKAAGINPSDVKNVLGAMHGTTLPRIPGRDFAGIVEEGPAEMVGRQVWGTGGDIGFTRDGSNAQYILLPAAAAAQKPANLSMEEAGSAGLTFLTAWSAIVTASQVAAGELVVIIGAAGGVGSASVQVAKSRGARVVGIVKAEEDFDAAKKNGADDVIVSGTANPADAVQKLTFDRGANVVFDTSGGMFSQSIEMAAMHGRVPVITAPPNGKVDFNLRTLYRHELRILGVDTRGLDATASARILEQMRPGFESGQFRTRHGKTMPLAEAPTAYEQAAGGGGAIVLLPS
jgi:NADPH2:quinone reductase